MWLVRYELKANKENYNVEQIPCDSINHAIAIFNNYRREFKDKWHFFKLELEGFVIDVKFYNTWTQILKVNGIGTSGSMFNNVTQWKAEFVEAFKYHGLLKEGG